MKLFSIDTAVGILIGVALVACIASHADNLRPTEDKLLHFGGCAAISGAVTLATDRPWLGFAAGAAVGVAKELYDRQHRERHSPSYHDLAYDLAGAAVGALVGDTLRKYRVRPNFNDGRIDGWSLAYSTEF